MTPISPLPVQDSEAATVALLWGQRMRVRWLLEHHLSPCPDRVRIPFLEMTFSWRMIQPPPPRPIPTQESSSLLSLNPKVQSSR